MTNLKTTHGSTDLRLFGLFASAIVHPFNNKLFACFFNYRSTLCSEPRLALIVYQPVADAQSNWSGATLALA